MNINGNWVNISVKELQSPPLSEYQYYLKVIEWFWFLQPAKAGPTRLRLVHKQSWNCDHFIFSWVKANTSYPRTEVQPVWFVCSLEWKVQPYIQCYRQKVSNIFHTLMYLPHFWSHNLKFWFQKNQESGRILM